ncbi:MAG: hypothetical protein EXR75_04450 [Myxococcales bacterium]|nr:hypothetical protein [Myxococcales bacterium]
MAGAALVAALAGGCAAPTVSLARGPREYVATDYAAVLDRWTRDESLFLFDELTRALTVTATFESWDFRWAYVIRYAQDYRLTIPQREELLKGELAETRDTHELFVALYGGRHKENDLTRADSPWIVRLIDSTGSEIAPAQIEAVKQTRVLERRYYPYNSVWRSGFRLRFPTRTPDGRPTISEHADWFGLRFAGAWGNTDLVWRKN